MRVEPGAHLQQFFFGEGAFKERELRPLPKAFEDYMNLCAPFVVWDNVGDDVEAALPASTSGDSG